MALVTFLRGTSRTESRAFCSVKINGILKDWFESTQGTKQGDNLSSNCFSMCINPPLGELESLGCGVHVEDTIISALAYADYLVLISESENDLQCLITTLQNWWLSVTLIKNNAFQEQK